MYHRLIASARRTFPGTRARADRFLLAFGLVIPSQEGTARLARFEAKIAVLVLQVGQHARVDDTRKCVPGKVECLQGVECEDKSWDVCRGRWLLGRRILVSRTRGKGKSH